MIFYDKIYEMIEKVLSEDPRPIDFSLQYKLVMSLDTFVRLRLEDPSKVLFEVEDMLYTWEQIPVELNNKVPRDEIKLEKR